MFHADSAACLVVDGKFHGAVAEERLGERQKHSSAFLTMREGGASSAGVAARIRANTMDGKVWRDCSLSQSTLIRLSKSKRKVLQFRAFP